jgi:hypothetical protein
MLGFGWPPNRQKEYLGCIAFDKEIVPLKFCHPYLIQISILSCTRYTLRGSSNRIHYILREKYCLLKESQPEVFTYFVRVEQPHPFHPTKDES